MIINLLKKNFLVQMDAFGIRIKEYILLMNMAIVKSFIRLKIIKMIVFIVKIAKITLY